jgi:hypothetical protein
MKCMTRREYQTIRVSGYCLRPPDIQIFKYSAIPQDFFFQYTSNGVATKKEE